MIWTVAAAAGLGASWLTDAVKPWVRIRSRMKVFVFFGADAALWVVLVLLLPRPLGATALMESGMLSLALGKTLHGFLSLVQAMKDRNRVEVVNASSMMSVTNRR